MILSNVSQFCVNNEMKISRTQTLKISQSGYVPCFATTIYIRSDKTSTMHSQIDIRSDSKLLTNTLSIILSAYLRIAIKTGRI